MITPGPLFFLCLNLFFAFGLCACGKGSEVKPKTFLIEHKNSPVALGLEFHDFEKDEYVFEKSQVLSKNQSIDARDVVFKKGVKLTLKNFNLSVRAESITFEKNVIFEGFPKNSQAPCFKSGQRAGNLTLLTDYFRGLPHKVSLVGENAGFVGTPVDLKKLTLSNDACPWEMSDYTKANLPQKYKTPQKGGDGGTFFHFKKSLWSTGQNIKRNEYAKGSPFSVMFVSKPGGLEEIEVPQGPEGLGMTLCRIEGEKIDHCF